MLIYLSRFSPVTIDSSQYCTTLAVRLDAPADKPGCGVFAGRHESFSPHEEGKLVQLIEADEHESRTFILDRPAEEGHIHLVRRWTYAAIGWDNGVYVEHPYCYTLMLQEIIGPESEHNWSVSVIPSTSLTGFWLVLNDYKPGALTRGITSVPRLLGTPETGT